MNDINNIVVIGAGTAGWLSALYMRKILPKSKITVIGSKEIGILGAGEGTTPVFIKFLNLIDVNVHDLIRECKSTVKLGIKFENWKLNKTGKYYHAFENSLKQASDTFNNENELLNNIYFNLMSAAAIGDNENAYQYSLHQTLMELNRINMETEMRMGAAVHFDAQLVAEFLKKISMLRNISYVDDIVTTFEQDEDGFIKKIKTNNGIFNCDFVIDCSGFKRLIIGKLFETKWLDVSESLPVKRAIPFFLPPNKKLENYTSAIAMNHGWMWKIPLQHRYGCGYVFDPDSCSDSEAYEELQLKFGDIESPRTFQFSSGYYDKFWVKNCIAVGLSAGFLEPMEATSIHIAISSLQFFNQFIPSYVVNKDFDKSVPNNEFKTFFDVTRDFVQFHYLNKRADTIFWRKVNNGLMSEELKRLIDEFKHSVPRYLHVRGNPMYQEINYLSIGLGIDFFSDEVLKESYNHAKINSYDLENKKEKLKEVVFKKAYSFTSHNSFISRINNLK